MWALAVAPSVTASEPRFEKLFTRPGVVGEGWTVRNWMEVSEVPKWPVVWEVDTDGVLHGTGRYATGTNGDLWIGTWLLSERQYGDFILELEFKFRNGGKSGNGGVALRAPLRGDPAYDGLELQITDPRYEYSYFPGASNAQLTGALYLVSAAKEQAYLQGEWNHYRIEMRGAKVEVWLNRKLVQDVDLDTLTQPAKRHGEGQELLDAPSGAARPRRGHIGFQDLSESGEVLLFRNVRIAELELVPTPVGFACEGGEERSLVVTFHNETDPPSAAITYGADQVIAFVAPSGSGARYTADGVEFWEHQGEATVDWHGTRLVCKAR
jgi:membrane-bound inhibitor of C-type lysozyme